MTTVSFLDVAELPPPGAARAASGPRGAKVVVSANVGEALGQAMNDQLKQWGERLAAEGAAAGTDQPSLRRLLGDAVGVVKGRLGEVS